MNFELFSKLNVMENTNLNMDKSMLSIAQTIWNGRKVILTVGIIAFVSSLTASLFIKNQYKTTATIFPPIANQVSKELVTENKQEGLTTFGETEEMEQFLQVLNSRTLKDRVIEKLNLQNHWEIDPTAAGSKYKTYKKFDEQIKIKPTRFQSINIEVMDRNPRWASDIANTVVEFSDSLMRSIKAQVASDALKALEKQFAQVQQELNSLQDSLADVMANGVIDPKRQGGAFYKEYLNALLKNNTSQLSVLNKEIAKFGGFGAKHIRYTSEISDLSAQLNELRKSIAVARIEAAQEIPTQFIIDQADVPDKKAYPIRSVIVITSTISAMVLTIFLLLLGEYFKQLSKNLNL